MTDAGNTARSNDTSSLRYKLLYAIRNPLAKSEHLSPMIPDSLSKSDRGLAHPMLAAMLCSQKHLAKFLIEDAQPDVTQDNTIAAEDENRFKYSKKCAYIHFNLALLTCSIVGTLRSSKMEVSSCWHRTGLHFSTIKTCTTRQTPSLGFFKVTSSSE